MKLAKNSTVWVSVPIFLTAGAGRGRNLVLSAVALAGFVFMIFFHRDPDRLPRGEGMLSPADGKIIQATPDRITIFMSPSNVHVNRAPLDGFVRNIEYRKGTHLPAFMGRACKNQQNRMHLETDDGDMELRQITGTLVTGDRLLRSSRRSGVARRKDRHDPLRLEGRGKHSHWLQSAGK